jgi:16S rRNA (uracil1498-N3)-methyltransferase
MLTNAEKVERDYFDAHVVREETWRPLLIEGLQQARDTRLPRVTVHKRFKVLIEDELDSLCPDCRRVVGVPAPERVVARADEPRPSRTLLAVGPEGGWNTFELELLRSRGFEDISLGRRTLRTDTATIGLLALLHRETLRG